MNSASGSSSLPGTIGRRSGTLRSREFAFVRLAGEPATFRQVFFEAGGRVRLQPLNLDHAAHVYRREQVLAMWRMVAHVAVY